MNFDKETLFNLLPAFDRVRDLEVGYAGNEDKEGPLKALLGVIAEQVAVIEENLNQLYDDQFIETCAEWVVPYIGELVASRGLVVFPNAPFSQRSQVANTIAYRRRKGTASILEQLAHDVTGWNANVIEYFQLLATTQFLNHFRPQNLSWSDLRPRIPQVYVNTPFDRMARTADVRRIEPKRGKYNIANVGIFLWRLDAYSLIKSTAYQVDQRRYKFDVLGKDVQLYNMPLREDEITHLAEPINVPMPIKKLILNENLGDYYGPGKSILIYQDGNPVYPAGGQNLSSLVCVCNLSDKSDGSGDWCNMPQHKIAIDPDLGRIAFPSANIPSKVHVNYHYGFSDKMGGGDYSRITSFQTKLEEVRKVRVPDDKATIALAIAEVAASGGVVEITNNETYNENLSIHVTAGTSVEIRAADLKRPVLISPGELLITGGTNSKIFINGLLLSCHAIRVPLIDHTGNKNQLESLDIRHSTILSRTGVVLHSPPNVPLQPALIIEVPGLQSNILKSILNPIKIDDEAMLFINGSVIDAGNEKLFAYSGTRSKYGAPLKIENTTVIGRVATRTMELASNTIFYAGSDPIDPFPVEVQRLQEGCVRFCYVPPGSRITRPYQCAPKNPATAARVKPLFNSLTYGKASYCQLSGRCAVEISQGADDGAEMGAYHDLYQSQRETNLKTRLNEYMRFGLEAGIFYGS